MLMANEIEVTIKTIASLIEQSSEYDSIYILLNGFTDKSLLSRLIKHARVFCFSCEGNLGVAGGIGNGVSNVWRCIAGYTCYCVFRKHPGKKRTKHGQ